MDVVSSPAALSEHLARFDESGLTIAFVPTMGNLHEGHLSLIRRGKELADVVVASIFVNPLQFGPNEDLDAYPRTLLDDIAKLEQEGTDLLFTPTVDVIYPEGLEAHTKVLVPGLTTVLCGASRPGHFDGVTTVVAKLLNLVSPDVAIFGEKDLQQLLVIRKMVRDLALPIAIEGVPTARATDGLALSSRNGYLSPEERAIAPTLQSTLRALASRIEDGARDYSAICEDAIATLEAAGFRRDYLEVRRTHDLLPAREDDREIAIFAALKLGQTRLIDNLQLSLPAA